MAPVMNLTGYDDDSWRCIVCLGRFDHMWDEA